MPRELWPWERCSQNGFAGIHIWQLDVERDETNRPVRPSRKEPPRVIAKCKVCGSRPNHPHEPDVIRGLEQQRDEWKKAEQTRRLFRSVSARRRA